MLRGPKKLSELNTQEDTTPKALHKLDHQGFVQRETDPQKNLKGGRQYWEERKEIWGKKLPEKVPKLGKKRDPF